MFKLSHKMFVNCIDNIQNQLFSQMSLRDFMELPSTERNKNCKKLDEMTFGGGFLYMLSASNTMSMDGMSDIHKCM